MRGSNRAIITVFTMSRDKIPGIRISIVTFNQWHGPKVIVPAGDAIEKQVFNNTTTEH